MNDRYPMMEATRKTSDKGLKAIRRKVSESSLKAVRRITPSGRRASSAAKQREAFDGKAEERVKSVVSPIAEHTSHQPSMLNRPRSMAYLGNFSRPRPSLDTNVAERSVELRLPTPRTVTREHDQRAKSAFDLRARYQTSNSNLRDSSINIRKRPVGTAPPPQTRFDDKTLQKIFDGPYADEVEQEGIERSVSGTFGKENAAPVPLSVPSLPAESMRRSSLNPSPAMLSSTRASASPSASRASLGSSVRPGSALQGRESERDANKGSPGQRMAEGFLNARRRERLESPGGSSPVFL